MKKETNSSPVHHFEDGERKILQALHDHGGEAEFLPSLSMDSLYDLGHVKKVRTGVYRLTKTGEKEVADLGSAPPMPNDLQLQVCPKCQANYNRTVLEKCPACSEPRPEMAAEALPEAVVLEPAPIVVITEYPFIGQPSEQGGVIIGVESGKVFRDMTESDVAEAAEEIGKVSITHAEVSAFLRGAEDRVADLEQQLKEHRSIVRNGEIRLLDVGAELAVLGRAVNSGKREWKTQLVHTYTKGNEIVVTDAKTGVQVGERRTATKEEAKKANGQTTGLLPPNGAAAQVGDISEAPKAKERKRRTTDSPHGKQDPGEQLIRVSVSASAYNRLTPPRKDGMRKVAGRDDDPVYPLNWSSSDDAGRLYVDIPRRLLGTVGIMAGPTLDFKQDTGAVVVEIE